MTEKAVYREITVCNDVVAETSLPEMQRHKVADISAGLEVFGVHLTAREEADCACLTLVPDEGRCHKCCILAVIVNYYLLAVVERVLPVLGKAERKAFTLELLDEFAESFRMLLLLLGLSEPCGKAVYHSDMSVDGLGVRIGTLLVRLEIIGVLCTAAAALRENRSCFKADTRRELLAFHHICEYLTSLIADLFKRTSD